MHTSPWKCSSPGSSVIRAEEGQGVTHTKNQSTRALNPARHLTSPHGWTYGGFEEEENFLSWNKRTYRQTLFSLTSLLHTPVLDNFTPLLPPFSPCFSWLLGQPHSPGCLDLIGWAFSVSLAGSPAQIPISGPLPHLHSFPRCSQANVLL